MSGDTESAIVHRGRLDDRARLIGKPFLPEALARKSAEVLELPIDMPGRAEDDNGADPHFRGREGCARAQSRHLPVSRSPGVKTAF